MTDANPDRAVGNANGRPRGPHSDVVLLNRHTDACSTDGYATAAHFDANPANRHTAAAHTDVGCAD